MSGTYVIPALTTPERSHDSQLLDRPRFLSEVSLIPTLGGFLVYGLAEPYHIDLPISARKTFLALIQLLDGSRCMSELKESLVGLPEVELTQAISILADAGLIENYTANSTASPSHIETLAYLRRLAATNREVQSGPQFLERLRTARIFICNSPNCADHGAGLKRLLLESGLDSVFQIDAGELSNQLDQLEGGLIISIAVKDQEMDFETRFDDLCRLHDRPWLRTVIDPESNNFDIGPLFVHRATEPCHKCFRTIYRKNTPALKASRSADSSWFLAILSMRTIYHILDLSKRFNSRSFTSYESPAYSPNVQIVAQVASCIGYSHDPSTSEYIDVCVLYEEYIRAGMAGRPIFSDQIGKQVYRDDLTREAKSFLGGRRIVFAEPSTFPRDGLPSLLAEEPIVRSGSLALEEIATILMLTGGWRKPSPEKATPDRWAATAGNLGSVEIFLIARHIAGIPDGSYFYHPRDHCLIAIRMREGIGDTSTLVSRSTRFGKISKCPEAIIVMTGAFRRVSRKYGSFGYRLIGLDAGVAMAQMTAVAASLGYQTELASSWADDLLTLELGLMPMDEQITAVLAIRTGTDGQCEELRRPHLGTPERSRAAALSYRSMSCHDVLKNVHDSSRLDELSLDDFATPKTREARPQSSASSAKDMACLASSSSLSSRSTVRSYSHDSVSGDALMHVLVTGLSHGCAVVRDERLGLTLHVLALRVNGLEPGLYTFCEATETLTKERDSPPPSVVQSLFVQSEFSSAPVSVWITANLATTIDLLGSYGHRLHMLKAGAVGQSLWLAALALGLQGGLAAGIVGRPVAEYLGLGGLQRIPLLAFTLGTSGEHP